MIHPRFLTFLKCIVGLIFFLKLLECAMPTGHGDALYYHLVLGKSWLESGLDFAYRNVCGAITTGLMDHLYVIPQYFFGSKIGAHIVSQYTHFLLSVGLICLICLSYFRTNRFVALIGCLAFLTLNHSPDMIIYPKNDGFMGAMSLLTALFIFDRNWLLPQESKLRPMMVGLLLGLLTIIKLNSLTIVGPLGLYYAFTERRNFARVVTAGSISLLIFSLILARNYYYMGNPLFPGFAKIFPGKMSQEMIDIYNYYMSNPLTLSSFGYNLKAFVTAKTALLTFPGLIIFKKFKPQNKVAFQLLLLSTLSFTLYLLTNGGIYAPRFIFHVLFLNIFVGLIWLSEIQIKETKWFFIILALVLVDSKLDKIIGRVKNITSYYPITNSQEQMNRISDKSRIFNSFRNLESQKIISDDFNEIYYAPAKTVLHSIECVPEANFLYRCDPNDLEKLKQYDYAILRFNKDNECYRNIISTPAIEEVDMYKIYKVVK